ncbi:hypothetical protein [Mesomycoplasma ovipneumoniae]|uniref:hypothetical protein n=1 Tax=Mesomycoplasma ovipneumoniae TaxID=29562 RepID=UPI00311CE145
MFPNFAVEPDNFVIKDLQKFEKIDIGNTDIKKIEYIKIKTLEEFNSLHNQITTA